MGLHEAETRRDLAFSFASETAPYLLKRQSVKLQIPSAWMKVQADFFTTHPLRSVQAPEHEGNFTAETRSEINNK
jgi:hypothetical protein